MKTRLMRVLPAVVSAILFIAAIAILQHELRDITWPVLVADVRAMPPTHLLAALLLTGINYVVLTGYDFIAFQYIGRAMSRWKIAIAAFLAYAIAHNVGFATVSGASVRYRFYSRWGVGADDLARIVFSYSVTFWLGLLLVGGVTLATSSLRVDLGLPNTTLVAPIGWLLAATSLAYVVLTAIRRAPIRYRGFELPLPRPRLAVAQLVLSVVDWGLAAAVLYVLLPAMRMTFPAVLGVFVMAQVGGIVSHVPGGVGVFEGLILLALSPYAATDSLVPALIVYRTVFYLLPLAIALTVLVADEVGQHRRQGARSRSLVTDSDLEDAAAAIARQRSAYPSLVYLRDKALLFDDTRTAFVMYRVQGHTWAAMGDPVGAGMQIPALIRAFLEKCDRAGGTPVFYEVGPQYLHHYVDYGLRFVKLGEQARVDIRRFQWNGGEARRHRQALTRLEKEGLTFRVAPASEVPALLGSLQDVSDDWLNAKAVSEKGFSLGFFDAQYLARFPVALIERGSRIEAFATLWPGPAKVELSVDLMRYRTTAPRSIMESLLTHVLRWAEQDGYEWLVLGMAPMSGFERSPVGPLWNRVGRFLYTHGDRLYNFQGLREFKDKFDPVWESHYLAYPGGLTLPRVLADVTAIVAGGYRKILVKQDRAGAPRACSPRRARCE